MFNPDKYDQPQSLESLREKLETITGQIARNIARMPGIRNDNAHMQLLQHIENQQDTARQIAHDANRAYFQEKK